MWINSGGEKIFPEEVESALKSHADVFDVSWSARPTSGGASVWPRSCSRGPGAAPTLDELSVHCRTRIAGYKVPRELHLVDVIVRSPSGKPDYPWAQQLVAEANEDVNA